MTTTPPYLDAAWFRTEEHLLSQVAALHNAGMDYRDAYLRTWGGEPVAAK